MSAESAKKHREGALSRTRELEVLERVRAIPARFVRTYGERVDMGRARVAD